MSRSGKTNGANGPRCRGRPCCTSSDDTEARGVFSRNCRNEAESGRTRQPAPYDPTTQVHSPSGGAPSSLLPLPHSRCDFRRGLHCGERAGVRGTERAVWPPHPDPLIWKDQSRGEFWISSTGTFREVVRSWSSAPGVVNGESGRGRRHSERRGLDTAVQGFVFEKRASVSRRACRTK